MRLKKTDWIFVLVVGAVIGTLVVLSLIKKQPKPVLVSVPEHAAMTADTQRNDCLVCHGPESGGRVVIDPLSHPTKWKDEKMKCTQCHVVH